MNELRVKSRLGEEYNQKTILKASFWEVDLVKLINTLLCLSDLNKIKNG